MKQHNTRLMKGALTLLTIAMLTFTGCKKEEDTSPSGGKTILKYELVSTSPFQVSVALGYSIATQYSNSTGQIQAEDVISTGTTWTKSIELTATQRPIGLLFTAIGYTVGTSGKVTMNLYENDVLKASKELNIVNISGYGTFIGNPGLVYTKQ